MHLFKTYIPSVPYFLKCPSNHFEVELLPTIFTKLTTLLSHHQLLVCSSSKETRLSSFNNYVLQTVLIGRSISFKNTYLESGLLMLACLRASMDTVSGQFSTQATHSHLKP